MTKRMLIDAAHPEETRVVVLDGSRVEEYDFESAAKRQLRGNIYLAKVTRVEPSLQAAFVEYGGNRHGFLAFNEIHPDYYQIPAEDRQKLIEEERRLSAAASEGGNGGRERAAAASGGETDTLVSADEEDDVDDIADEAASRRRAAMRKYKIQEVIKRRQVLLVQVVKEERGSKGAALTTYLSLAGRYCVLMPNTARGGGISRKITSAADRKRLRKIVDEFDLAEGVGLIVRTAGAKRTKTEIKRDFDYLVRLWDKIRTIATDPATIAPRLIHEEDDIVKRAIRDLYDKDIEEILVEGEAAYRDAKDFIRMLMPSHAKKVQNYKEDAPLFLRYGAEEQLAQIYDPIVNLRSGGYIVINQTEALVAIDVNSGRATRERNIEATALKTNIEAADEACRQFRLRDLAGLLVIDFIDMDEAKNTRQVEKRMRDALKRDRARVQASKISQFGLMEMSRQRRRASIIEGSHRHCEVCKGRGLIRSVESSALHLLRQLEASGQRRGAACLKVRAAPAVALYILNEKRSWLNALEARYAMSVHVVADETLVPPDAIVETIEGRRPEAAEAGEEHTPQLREPEPKLVAEPLEVIDLEGEEDEEIEAEAGPHESRGERGEDDGQRRRRRRRRRRGGAGRGQEAGASESSALDVIDPEAVAREADEDADADAGEAPARSGDPGERSEGEQGRRRRRRGRRGGQGRRTAEGAPGAEMSEATEPLGDDLGDTALESLDREAEPVAETRPSRPPRAPKPDAPEPEPALADAAPAERALALAEVEESAPEPAPAARRAPQPEPKEDPEAEERRRRWQDRLKSWLGG